VNVRSSIVAGNTASSSGPDLLGPFISQGHNLVGKRDGSAGFFNGANNDIVGTTNAPVNPQLLPLGNYGGPTQTQLPRPTSPAIDAGDDAVSLATDQRGFPRMVGAHVDIGAVEVNYVISPTAGSFQNAPINTAFAAQLQATVTESGNPVSGVPVTFTAPVSGPSGTFQTTGTNTATVNTDSNGVATAPVFTANSTVGGPYNVTASLGTVPLSVTFSLTNGKVSTTNALSSSANPSASGQSVTFTATFSSSAGTPTGTVTFKDNGSAIPTCTNVALSSGQATCTTSSLAVGNHTIEADYSGDANFNSSSSTNQQVVAAVLINFSQATYTVAENAGSITITVTRTGDTTGTVAVNFNTQNGSAQAGQDYGDTAGTLTFGPGVTSQTFQVPIIADTRTETNRSLNLQLSGPTNGATLGSQSSATLVIIDNDPVSDIFAVTVSNKLLRFRSDNPGTVNVVGSITGLQPNEQIVSIDVRPATGQLYALGNTNGTGRLYIVNTTTAAATLVAALAADPSDTTSPYTALAGTAFGADFDPVADSLRVVSNARQNLRVNPSNGQVITDDNLGYGASDANFGANPNIVAAAYTNSFAGATSTTLFDIDSNLDEFVMQDPPNNGLLTSSGPFNGNTTELTGLDIRGSDNAIFASLTAPGDSASKLALFVGNTNIEFVGTIGGGELVRDIAIAPAGAFRFNSPTATVSEGAGTVSLTVTRTGDTTGTSSVECDTADGTATQKGDYTIARNRLTFGPGDTTKQCVISIVDDAFQEPDETFTVTLTNPTDNFVAPLGSNTVTVTIKDNDNGTAPNPVDSSAFFVRQQYLDFLGREPDINGFNFWFNNIESCGSDQNCRAVKRVDTSAAFFLSIEFQETGFYVLRVQRVAFSKRSDLQSARVIYTDFIRDSRQVDQGVIIGQPGASALLDQNKTAYALQVVNSPQFTVHESSPTAYVNDLYENASVTPTSAEKQNAIVAFGIGDAAGRAAALRAVADSDSVRQAEFNSAFVLMEYFGYLRRNPTDAPDNNDDGYQFWLTKLTSAGGDFRQAEMVKAFITSAEYRQRFGN
jgi:hypothetical protein